MSSASRGRSLRPPADPNDHLDVPGVGRCQVAQGLTSARPFVSVQLRLRLRLVPVRPCRYVLQVRLEEVVQELLLRVLHLREDLARGRRPTPHREFASGLERSMYT